MSKPFFLIVAACLLCVPALQAQESGSARSQRMVLHVEAHDTTPPDIIIVEPSQSRGIGVRTRESSLRIAGRVVDASLIESFSINGEALALGQSGDFDARVPLEYGRNEFILVASDASNNTATERVVKDRDPEVDITGRFLALVIGIDEYTGRLWTPLNNAVRDARAVADVLKNDYTFDLVVELYDQEATRERIYSTVEELADRVQPEDNLVIYYSGHGQLDDRFGRGAWVPVDARTRSTAGLVENTTVQNWVQGIESKHTLLITDACFAGDLFRSGATAMRDFVGTTDYYQKVHDARSRKALTSGGVEPVMDGGADGHSVFTYYLLKALRENTAPFFDAAQLFDAIRIPVLNNSEQTPLFLPMKNSGDEGGQFVFVRR